MKLTWNQRKLLFVHLFGAPQDSFEAKMDALAATDLNSMGEEFRDFQSEILGSGYNLLDDLNIDGRHPGTLLEYFQQLLMGRNVEPAEQGSIIEALALTLQNSYSRNVLAGGVLKALRKVILTDTEVLGLAERLRKREMFCGECGEGFTDAEMITLRVTSEGPTLCCTRCSPPAHYACATPGCSQKTEIRPKFRQMFKFLCAHHLSGGKKPLEAISAPDVAEPAEETQARPTELFRTTFGGVDLNTLRAAEGRFASAITRNDPRVTSRATTANRFRGFSGPGAAQDARAIIESVRGPRTEIRPIREEEDF